MSKGRQGAIATLIAMTSRASSQVVLIGVTLVATRYLNPADFGVFALATAFVTLARTLLYAGPFEYLMKAPDLEKSALECLVANALLAAVSTIVLACIAFLSPLIFRSPAVEPVLLMLAPSILIAAVASWEESQLLRQGNIRTYYAITTGVELVSSGLAVVMLVRGYGLIALIVQNYVRAVLLTIGYWRMLTLPRLRRVDPHHLATVVRWSISRYGSVILSFTNNYSGDLILGAILSPASTGVYRAGSRIVGAASDIFAQPAAIMSMAGLSRRYAAGNPADGHWLTMLSGIALFGWPALAGMAIVANRLAPIALGEQWTAAGPVISILCMARMGGFFTIFAGTSLFVYDRQRLVLIIQIVTAIASAGLTCVFAPLMGVIGAATAAACSSVVSGGGLVYFAARQGGFGSRQLRTAAAVMVIPLCATVIAAVTGDMIAAHVASDAIAQLVIVIILGAGGWAMSIALLRRQVLNALHSLSHAPAQTNAATDTKSGVITGETAIIGEPGIRSSPA